MRQIKQDGQDLLKAGAIEACEVVLSTMGAYGHQVAIPNMRILTKDGYTVATQVGFDDETKNCGARLVEDACKRTVDEAGDATTTTCAIIHGLLTSAVGNPVDMARMLLSESPRIERLIDAYVSPATPEDILHVATTAINHDVEIGKQVADVVNEIGVFGKINVRDHASTETKVVIERGYGWDGLINQAMLSAGPSLLGVKAFENPYVLLTDEFLRSFKDIKKVVENWQIRFKEEQAPLVIIAADVTDAALQYVLAALKQGVEIYAVKAPIIEKNYNLSDLAFLTDGKVFSKGTPLMSLKPKDFGRCQRFEIELTGGVRLYQDKDVDAYCEGLNEDRVARLKAGIATIYGGGATVTERTATNFLIEDAETASMSALRHGVLPGGGSVLYQLGFGEHPMIEAGLQSPFKWIAQNAGTEAKHLEGHVLNILTGQHEPYDETVILDSAAAIKAAWRNGVSIAASILNSQYAVI